MRLSNKDIRKRNKKICVNCRGKNYWIQCKCGKCNELIPIVNNMHNIATYKKGHYLKKHPPIQNSHNWKNGIAEWDDYIHTHSPEHPNRINGNYVATHRLIYENYLSIMMDEDVFIPSYMDVHHINGNKKDNSLINLELLTKSEHAKIHHKRLDMSDRICFLCGSDKTYIRKTGKYEQWHFSIEGNCICDRCYRKIHHKKKI